MAGAVLSVVVTIDDEEYTDATKAVAGEDKSAEVELVDDYGLQSDGTGIIGDKLTVTYGADFGTPTNVSWYKNGKVVATNSVGDTVNNGLTRTISASEWGTGTYKVTITNTDGEMATTNEIVITDKEEAAKITGFTLEDDYTDGTDITYETDDDTVIATVKLNKNYAGTISVYKATDTKFSGAIDSITTSVDVPVATAAQAVNTASGIAATGWTGYPGDGASVLTTNQATNYQVVNAGANGNAASIGSGYGYIAEDGTVTYKFALNNGVKTRGQDYVVTFDQDSISTDTPGTGTANKFGTAATVPYVKAIKKIAITKVANGTAPEITFYDEAGKVMSWLGDGTTTTTLTGAKIAKCGIYGSKVKANDPTASGLTTNSTATTAPLSKGVWTSPTPAGTDAYWFATLSTTAGIYGASAETITSEAVPNAQDSATIITLTEDSSDAYSAKVAFTNLRADGTVYIVRGYYEETAASTNGTTWDVDRATTPANIFAGFNKDDPNTYTAKLSVSAGAGSVVVPNAIAKWETTKASASTAASYEKAWAQNYIAVFIPDDLVNYGMIYTDGTTTNAGAGNNFNLNTSVNTTDSSARSGVTITQAKTTYEVDKTKTYQAVQADDATSSITFTDAIVVKDQFGTVISAPGDLLTGGAYALNQKTDGYAGKLTAVASANGTTGYDTITLAGTDTGVGDGTFDQSTKGDTWYIRVANSVWFVFTCTTATNNTTQGDTWTISVSTTQP